MLKSMLKTSTLMALCGLTACAAMIEGSGDKINITTMPPSQASCTASNALSNSAAYAPGQITGIHKSKTDLKVDCVDVTSGARGTRSVESEFDFLSLLGGLIGVGIDASIGTMWDYPQEVQVPLAYSNGTLPGAAAPYAAPAPAAVPQPQYYAPAAPAPTQQ